MSFSWLPNAVAVAFELLAFLENWIAHASANHIKKGKALTFELHSTRDLRIMYFFTVLKTFHPPLICRLQCHTYKDWVSAVFIQRHLRLKIKTDIEVSYDNSLSPIIPPHQFVTHDFLINYILNDPELSMIFYHLLI
jgi:hypothetical protein